MKDQIWRRRAGSVGLKCDYVQTEEQMGAGLAVRLREEGWSLDSKVGTDHGLIVYQTLWIHLHIAWTGATTRAFTQ